MVEIWIQTPKSTVYFLFKWYSQSSHLYHIYLQSTLDSLVPSGFGGAWTFSKVPQIWAESRHVTSQNTHSVKALFDSRASNISTRLIYHCESEILKKSHSKKSTIFGHNNHRKISAKSCTDRFIGILINFFVTLEDLGLNVSMQNVAILLKDPSTAKA